MLIQLTLWSCHFKVVLFVLRFPLAMYFEYSRCCLLREDKVKYVCGQNMNHLLRQVSGKKMRLGLLLVCDVLYLLLNSAITFAGESHVACHNDTQDIATLL